MPPIYDHVEKRSQIEAGEVACGLLNLHWEQRSEAFLVWWPTGYVMKDSLAIDFTGGPGRTRTCNQTVMSGWILICFVDFRAFLFEFDRVHCVLTRSFLVRNWCGVRG